MTNTTKYRANELIDQIEAHFPIPFAKEFRYKVVDEIAPFIDEYYDEDWEAGKENAIDRIDEERDEAWEAGYETGKDEGFESRDNEINDLEDKISELESEIEDLKEENESIKAELEEK